MDTMNVARSMSPAGKARRNQSVEILRIIAAFGILAYHSGAPFHDAAYAGLVCFLLLSPAVDALYNWDRVRSLRSLAITLLVPWLFWFAVYGAANFLARKPVFVTTEPFGAIAMGTSQHLWFMPFMFLVLVGLGRLKLISSPAFVFWGSAVLGAILLASVSWWRPLSLTWPLPLPQWMHAGAAVLVGLSVGLAPRMGKAAIAGIALIAAALMVALAAQLPGVSITYPLGIIAAAAALIVGERVFPATWSVQPVANCMLGVYLVHILALSLVSAVLGKANYLTVTAAFLLSLACVAAARRWVPMSKLVLG